MVFAGTVVSSYIIGFLFFLLGMVFVLIQTAFTTWAERVVMAGMQRRKGPNVVGFGVLQAFADGLKLVLKEAILPSKANPLLFLMAPMLVLVLSLYIWLFLPVTRYLYSDFSLAFLYILVVGIFEIYGIVFAGWASNSKYALLGSLRSTAQMISYEISLSFVFLGVIFLVGSFNLQDIIVYQTLFSGWLIWPLFPFAIVFFVSMLAETNRTPFDLPEAEAELVAGYNVEYSGFLFALFFLSEYTNMLFLSGIFSALFLGGGSLPFITPLLSHFLGTSSFFFHLCLAFVFAGKSMFILFSFIWVRATLPRYRYDQLMDLGWKVFLPLTFGYLVVVIGFLYLTETFPLLLVL
jgi:NADH-quinone oxidoreductase subunit H